MQVLRATGEPLSAIVKAVHNSEATDYADMTAAQMFSAS